MSIGSRKESSEFVAAEAASPTPRATDCMIHVSRKIALWSMAFVCFCFFCLYTGRGLYLSGISPALPLDFSLRWAEQKDVATGINPYQVSERLYQARQETAAGGHPGPVPESHVKTWIGSGYPPWAFFWANLFIPPLDVRWSRHWFFAANLLALGVLAAFAWRSMPEDSSKFHRAFACSATLSANAIGTTLGNGQWGLILMALLIGTSWTAGKARGLPSGFLFAVALLKPTFSFATAGALAGNGQWRSLATALTLTLAAAWAVAWHVGTTPQAMVGQMFEQSSRWEDLSYSLPDGLHALGLPRTPTLLFCLAGGTLLSFWLSRRSSGYPLACLAITGVVARVFTYHQLYNNVLIVFLVIWLTRRYVTHHRLSDLTGLCLVMASLWIPGRFTHSGPVQCTQIAIWIAASGLVWKYRGK